VYVPDTHYHRVVVYSPDGRLLRKWGERGFGPGQFMWPTDVAFDAAATCTSPSTATTTASRSSRPTARFVRAFGQFGNGDGQFSRRSRS
jgi:hypothetical protein